MADVSISILNLMFSFEAPSQVLPLSETILIKFSLNCGGGGEGEKVSVCF